MTHRFDPHPSVARGSLVALGWSIALVLACNGRLDVTDEPIAGAGGGGSGGTAGSAGSASGLSCTDGIRNGNEQAIDCGGSCPACASGNPCTNPIECQEAVCLDGVCQAATCDDGVRNGEEEGVDCGGTSNCGPCLTLCHADCAVSDTLIPMGCDPSAPRGGIASLPQSNDDGSIIAFDTCDYDSRCSTTYFTLEDGPRPLEVTSGGIFSGISADGQVVLVSPQVELGAESLLFSPDGSSVTTGMAPRLALLSADGSVVGVNRSTNGAFNLLRLPRGGEQGSLGELPFGDFLFTGATPDASVIVGYSTSDTYKPFRYTEDGGLMVGLDSLPEGADGAAISALSRDGQSFAGVISRGSDRLSVFRWTQVEGIVELMPVAPATPSIDALGMAFSDDGSVLVFSGETNAAAGAFGAFRWTREGGSDSLTPNVQSTAALISGDGRVIIGKGSETDDFNAFYWKDGRPRSIRATLEGLGVDLRGWRLDTPLALSRDGRVAMGFGQCGEKNTMYRLVLPE
jgi:uncharacterized membrane protein